MLFAIRVFSRTEYSQALCYLQYVCFPGLDIPKHGEPAYPMESYGHGHIETVLRILESGQLQSFVQGQWFRLGVYSYSRNLSVCVCLFIL